MVASIFAELHRASVAGEPGALGIITGVKGSSPQKIGAKALFFADGRIIGTLGGGCLEAEIQDRARRALRSGVPAEFELVLDHDFGWDDGLICGGKVYGVILPQATHARTTPIWHELSRRCAPLTWGVRADFTLAWAAEGSPEWRYTETVRPPCALWIAGAGHIAQAVAPLAHQLDFSVLVMDDRPALANHAHFPAPTVFQIGAWEEILKEPMPAVPTFALIVTRGHRHDALVLRHWISRPFIFTGMIGSSRKWRLIQQQFRDEQIATETALAAVACPVGVPIIARSVHEIGISIIAQYIQKRAEWFERGSDANTTEITALREGA